MNSSERARILNMVKEGKLSVEEAEMLLSSMDGKTQAPSESVVLKDTRGRKGKKLKVIVDGGENKNAKVNISIPISIVRTIGPMIAKGMPKEAQEKLDENGIDLAALMRDIDELLDSGMEEDFVNIDADDEEGKSTKVRIYVE